MAPVGPGRPTLTSELARQHPALSLLQEATWLRQQTGEVHSTKRSALHYAAWGGRVEVVEVLLATPGINLGLLNKYKRMPLAGARFRCRPNSPRYQELLQIIAMLEARGAK